MGRPEQRGSDFPEGVGPSFKFQLILHCIGLDLFKITFMEIISFAPLNNPEKQFYHYFHPTANKSEVSEVRNLPVSTLRTWPWTQVS